MAAQNFLSLKLQLVGDKAVSRASSTSRFGFVLLTIRQSSPFFTRSSMEPRTSCKCPKISIRALASERYMCGFIGIT